MTEGLEEIRLFNFKDIAWLFCRKKKLIIRSAVSGLFLAFLLVFITGPKYYVVGSFREQKERVGTDSLMKEFFAGVTQGSAPEANSIMKSRAVLRPLVEKLGLQVKVRQGSFVFKVFRRLFDLFKAELEWPLSELDLFRFKDVKYEEEIPCFLKIRFTAPDQFEIFDGKERLSNGVVGSPVCLDSATFTIEKTPKSLRLQQIYPLQFVPWVEEVESLTKSLSIVANKTNKSIYFIGYRTRDRIGGSKIVNELMAQFQQFLKREYNEFSQSQISYLDQRQNEIYQQFEGTLKEHAAYLSQNLGEEGFMNLAQELQVYVKPHLKMVDKSFAIDLELACLDQGGILSENAPFSNFLQAMRSKIQELQEQRDLLEISVSQSSCFKEAPEPSHRELDEIRKKRQRAEDFLKEWQMGSFLPDWITHLDPMIASWAGKVLQTEISLQEKQDFTDYLSNWVRLLSVREKILGERFLHKGSIPPEFEGIDLKTSRSLFSEYNNRLDGSEASMRHIANLKNQISQDDFELGSLGSVLKDPVSQNLISRAMQINFQLKDEKYCSLREEARGKDELALQRNLLKEHLEQLYRVEELNSHLIREKIFGLQQVGLDCINRQISVIHEQIKDAVSSRKTELLQEKKMLDEKMVDIRSHLVDLPQKWHMENMLNLKAKMNQKIMGAVSELVESKTIGHHLHHIESKPLDRAVAPFVPCPPHLLASLFIGSFVGGFGLFFISLIRTILKGFPINGEKLKALKLPLSGEISSDCDGSSVEEISRSDLESMRKICLFADQEPKATLLALLMGQGPDFSLALAGVAVQMGRKVCSVRCDFEGTFQESDRPGVLQALEGESLPLRSQNGYEIIPTGGYSRFGAEIIQSKKFLNFVDSLKKRYDLILLCFRGSLEMAESKGALRICDKAVVAVRGEEIDLLTPFASWAYHENNCRLTFVASEIP